jgi:hypothetical protein
MQNNPLSQLVIMGKKPAVIHDAKSDPRLSPVTEKFINGKLHPRLSIPSFLETVYWVPLARWCCRAYIFSWLKTIHI